MSGPLHPTGRGRVSQRSPRALAVCQRCNFTYNRIDLQNQSQWQGMQLQPLNIYVCRHCLDRPQQQLRTIILPPDPIPVWMPFQEQYDSEVPSFLMGEDRSALLCENGSALLWEITDTPNPDPNNPADYPA